MIRFRYVTIIILLTALLIPVFSHSQELKYEFVANIDLSAVKNPVLQLNIDDLGCIYNTDGRYITKVEAEPSFERINQIAVDKRVNLYVLDSNNPQGRVPRARPWVNG